MTIKHIEEAPVMQDNERGLYIVRVVTKDHPHDWQEYFCDVYFETATGEYQILGVTATVDNASVGFTSRWEIYFNHKHGDVGCSQLDRPYMSAVVEAVAHEAVLNTLEHNL